MFSTGDPQVNLKGPVSQCGKTGLACGLQHLTVWLLFGLLKASFLSLSKCYSWIFFFFNGTNLLCSYCVSSMKALYWQRTLGCRAELMDTVPSVIQVVPWGACTFLQRAEAGEAEKSSESQRAGAVVSLNDGSSNLIAVASPTFIDASHVLGTRLSASHTLSYLNWQQPHELSTVFHVHG